MKSWSLLNDGKPLLSMPKIAVLRSFMMNHLIHHRGQLSVYLRLTNTPVPSIYGPSADDRGRHVMAIKDALLPEFDHEMATARKVIERVPDDKFGYKPHEKSMTMGALASHIADMPTWATSRHHSGFAWIWPAASSPFKPHRTPNC